MEYKRKCIICTSEFVTSGEAIRLCGNCARGETRPCPQCGAVWGSGCKHKWGPPPAPPAKVEPAFEVVFETEDKRFQILWLSTGRYKLSGPDDANTLGFTHEELGELMVGLATVFKDHV